MTYPHIPGLPEVLILEDDAATASILQIWFKGICNSTVVENGDSTLELIEQWMDEGQTFDLLIFDINIPYPWNGVILLQEIRKRWEKYQKIPAIAETAYALPNDREYILANGYSSYLAKPLDREEMVGLVKKYLGMKTMSDPKIPNA